MNKKEIFSVGEFPYWPNNIKIGIGVRKSILYEIKARNVRRIIFFTDNNVVKFPETQELIALIKSAGYNIFIYSEIEENPSDNCVEDAVCYMKQVVPDLAIYYGGGSVIDLGKAANLVYTHGGKISEYEDLAGGIEKIKNILLPSIAIPTTAGTGSEVSSVSVITDTRRMVKMGILSTYIIPDVSILDAEVTKNMPPDLTAYTGIDALTHCIEAYVSNICFEPGRGIAYQGIKIIKKYLCRAVEYGNDLNARENMLVASACGAMAFNNNFLGTVHACAHQLSTVAKVPHGLANAIMLIPVMKWNLDSNVNGYAEIAQALGIDIYNISPAEAANKAIDEIRRMERAVNIPEHLADVGVSYEMLNELVDKAYEDHNNLSNPKFDEVFPNPVSKQVLKSMFLEVL